MQGLHFVIASVGHSVILTHFVPALPEERPSSIVHRTKDLLQKMHDSHACIHLLQVYAYSTDLVVCNPAVISEHASLVTDIKQYMFDYYFRTTSEREDIYRYKDLLDRLHAGETILHRSRIGAPRVSLSLEDIEARLANAEAVILRDDALAEEVFEHFGRQSDFAAYKEEVDRRTRQRFEGFKARFEHRNVRSHKVREVR